MVESGVKSENEQASCWCLLQTTELSCGEGTAVLHPSAPAVHTSVLICSLLGGVSVAHDEIGLACSQRLHPRAPTTERRVGTIQGSFLQPSLLEGS